MVKAHWLRNHSSLPPLLVLLLPHSFLPSLHPSVHPPPRLPSLVSYSLATSSLSLSKLCFSNSPAIHYARPAGMTLNTHRDPKQVPHTHMHTHSSGGITHYWRGKIRRDCKTEGLEVRGESCLRSTAGRTTRKEKVERTLKGGERKAGM